MFRDKEVAKKYRTAWERKNREKRKKYKRDRYKNNLEYREKYKSRIYNWRRLHKDRVQECRKKINATPKGKLMNRESILRRYGLTLEQYDEMFREQEGVCAICGRPEKQKDKLGNIKRLAVDHNHITGEVRGLLCIDCNSAIGRLDADKGTELLTKAINYIKGKRK